MKARLVVERIKELGGVDGIGLVGMGLASAVIVALLLTWASPSRASYDTALGAALAVQAQLAERIKAPANARRDPNELPRGPACAAPGTSARTPDTAQIAQASDVVGCGIPGNLAEVTPTLIGTEKNVRR